jgi:hypothetical protein
VASRQTTSITTGKIELVKNYMKNDMITQDSPVRVKKAEAVAIGESSLWNIIHDKK